MKFNIYKYEVLNLWQKSIKQYEIGDMKFWCYYGNFGVSANHNIVNNISLNKQTKTKETKTTLQ